MASLDKLNAADSTAKKQIGRPFQPGQSGNLLGRPKGSRNKLSAQFFDDLYSAWQEYGEQALKQLALENPKDFVKVAAMVVPREVELEVSGQIDLLHKVETFREAYQLALQHIGAEPLMIEAERLERL